MATCSREIWLQHASLPTKAMMGVCRGQSTGPPRPGDNPERGQDPQSHPPTPRFGAVSPCAAQRCRTLSGCSPASRHRTGPKPGRWHRGRDKWHEAKQVAPLSPWATTCLCVSPPLHTSASGRQSLAPSAKPPPTPSVPKAPAWTTAGVTRVSPAVTTCPGPGGVLTRVQPGEGAAGAHDVGGGAHEVPPVGHQEALGGQQRVQAVQQVQGVQVLRGGGRCLLPVREDPAPPKNKEEIGWGLPKTAMTPKYTKMGTPKR